MKSCKVIFLEKAVLGRATDLEKSEEVIKACIKLAYRDMLTAGRFYLSDEIEMRCKRFKGFLETYNYQFSRKLINDTLTIFGDKEIIGIGEKYVTRYGLAQKLVNMTYKYFYVFSDRIDKNIDFSVCDCPLDSIILGKLKENTVPWSKATKEEYDRIQGVITELLDKETLNEELKKTGRLAFDFINW